MDNIFSLANSDVSVSIYGEEGRVGGFGGWEVIRKTNE